MIIGIDASRANVPEKTGTEWYSWHLIRELAKLSRSHTVRLYTREPLEPGLRNLGPHIEERVLKWVPGLLWSHLRLAWELFRHPPDVLFVPADTVPLVHPNRTYTTIHDVAFERFPELYRGQSVQRRLGWLRPLIHLAVRICTLGRYSASERDYHRWSARHALRASRKVFTVSEFSKREIIETLGAVPDQIVVTPLGISPVHAERLTVTAGQPTSDDAYFLFFGRLEKKKNIVNIVKAYARYRPLTSRPVSLVLAGSPGYGWPEAEAVMRAEHLQDHVRVLGWLSPADKNALLARAGVFLFVSRYEGFGLPPLEAMAVGVPVLSSRAGSLPEVLGSAALYTDADDPDRIARDMLRLSQDSSLRTQLQSAGFERANRFTWQRCAKQTWDVLAS